MTTFFTVDSNYRTVFMGVSGQTGSDAYADNVIGGYASTFGITTSLTKTVALGAITLASAQNVQSVVAIGQAAGSLAKGLSGDVLMGVAAGYSISGGGCNVAIGHSAAQYQKNSTNNVFVGYGAGYGTESTPGSNNTRNVVLGDGALRFSSSNASNVILGVTTMNYSSNNSGCVILGNDVGPLSNCASTIAIGHSGLSGFTGSSNILIGHGLTSNTSVVKTIAIGHELNISGATNKLIVGMSSNVMLYADFSTNTMFLGGSQGQFSIDSSGTITSNVLNPNSYVTLQGPVFNPYTRSISFATNDVVPIASYIFVDQDSTATSLRLDTSVGSAIRSSSYNLDMFIGNNTSHDISLTGSFYSVNALLSERPQVVLSASTILKFKRLLFVNPEAVDANRRYYIGYLQ